MQMLSLFYLSGFLGSMASFLFPEAFDKEILEKLPLGYGFNPSDEQLFAYCSFFLQCYNYYSSDQRFDIIDRMPIGRIDLCDVEPSDLPVHSKIKSVHDQEWYFFTPRRIYTDKKKRTYKRSTKTGYWKPTSEPTIFGHLGQRITLSFQNHSSDKTNTTPFLIHEYDISSTSDLPNPENYVLIKVMFQNQEKKTLGSKRRNRCSTSKQNKEKKIKRSKTKSSFVSTPDMVNAPESDRTSVPSGLQNQNIITGSDRTLSCSLGNQDLAVGDTTATSSSEYQNAMSCSDMAPNQTTPQYYNSSPHNQNTSSQYHNSSIKSQTTLFQYHNSSIKSQTTPSQHKNYEPMDTHQTISDTNLDQVIPSMEMTAMSTYIGEPQDFLQPLQNNDGEPKNSQQDFSWPNQSSLLGFQGGECSSKSASPDLDLENQDDSSQLNFDISQLNFPPSSFLQDISPSSTMEQGEHSAPMATPYTQNKIRYEKDTSSSMAYNSGSYKPNEVGNMPVPQESSRESQHSLSQADFNKKDGEEVTSRDMFSQQFADEWELICEIQSVLDSQVQQPLGTEETTSISGDCVSTTAPS